jgi:hypothetical protein
MKIYLSFLFIITISLLYPGCSTTNSDSGNASLKGYVFDTTNSSLPKIVGATIYLQQINATTASDTGGYFIFTNLASGLYNVEVTKPGYNRFSTTVFVNADTATWMTAPLTYKNVYIFDGIVLDEHFASTSNSAANFLIGRTVPDNTTEKDIQLRDTIIGADTLLWVRSSSLDPDFTGYSVFFSNMFGQTYTKTQFDTLSRYNTQDGIIYPYRDFPNINGIDRFINYHSYENNVCAFSMEGRYLSNNTIPRVYGLMYINSVWYDYGINAIRIRVDIKINTGQENYFNFGKKK